MFKKVALDNNIPLLLESMHEVRSVCIGIWVKIGARDEKPGRSGISHFLEHMLFKGHGKTNGPGYCKGNRFYWWRIKRLYVNGIHAFLYKGVR